jgi:hypothetical protein
MIVRKPSPGRSQAVTGREKVVAVAVGDEDAGHVPARGGGSLTNTS